jgi:peptidoglycan/xylan/chitin deacetylase (PgdA/CDA1 family)
MEVMLWSSPMELIFKGSSQRRVLALTIDDAPSSGREDPTGGTAALLDLLGELKIPATFFCIGERVRAHRGMAARAVAEGHELGNHMWRDQWSVLLSEDAFHQQLELTEEVIQADLRQAGQPATPLKWFRPSGGWPTPQMVGWAQNRGYRTVLGSIWPFDGLKVPLLSAEKRLELQEAFVERFAHPGGILVMHDTPEANPLTRETLRTVVPRLKEEGYGFVTLSALLG